jgi:hypothetical protein
LWVVLGGLLSWESLGLNLEEGGFCGKVIGREGGFCGKVIGREGGFCGKVIGDI